MNDVQEIIVKVFIAIITVFLIIVEITVIEIRIVKIVATVIAFVLVIWIIEVEVRKLKKKRKLCHAFIYKHRENGSIILCENDQGEETRDFVKLGEGKFACDRVNYCSFVK